MDRDKIGSLFFLVLSVVVCLASIKIGIGTPSNPGSGFMSFFAGLFFGLLSLLQIGKLYFRKKSKQNMVKGEAEEGGNREGIKRIILVIVALSAYCIIMPRIGYLISTFLLMVFLLRIGSSMKWRLVIASSLFITFCSYLIFDKWLSCRFPGGILQYSR